MFKRPGMSSAVPMVRRCSHPSTQSKKSARNCPVLKREKPGSPEYNLASLAAKAKDKASLPNAVSSMIGVKPLTWSALLSANAAKAVVSLLVPGAAYGQSASPPAPALPAMHSCTLPIQVR
jgi:hypothetical protein